MERKIRILVAEDFDLLREDLCEFLDSQEDMEAAGSAGGKEEIVRLELWIISSRDARMKNCFSTYAALFPVSR